MAANQSSRWQRDLVAGFIGALLVVAILVAYLKYEHSSLATEMQDVQQHHEQFLSDFKNALQEVRPRPARVPRNRVPEQDVPESQD
jgi:hypothetical protein